MRGFGLQSSVEYFETFAPTPSISYVKRILAIPVQQGCKLQHWDFKQVAMNAELDVEVYTKLFDGRREKSGKVVKLECTSFAVKQAGRQWSALLCNTLADTFGMEQCRADPCVFRKMKNKEVVLILVVHFDDLLVSGNETVCEELLCVLHGQFSTQSLGELEWYLGCAVERHREKGTIKISQPAMVDTPLARFDVQALFQHFHVARCQTRTDNIR